VNTKVILPYVFDRKQLLFMQLKLTDLKLSVEEGWSMPCRHSPDE
jgi:hypothetical protein